MSFRSMKALPIILYMILGIGLVASASFYSWNGKLVLGDKVRVDGLTLTVDADKTTGELALIISNESGIVTILKDGEFVKVGELTVSFNAMNDHGLITVSSDEFFNVAIPTPEQSDELETLKEENEELKKENKQLKEENTKLKQRVSELEKQMQNKKPNTAELNAKILNLTKENRELKAELANITNKYNQLKAKADFLSQQNEEYRQIIQQVMEGESSEAKQSYIEKAKKEALIGSVLWKSLIGSAIVVGLVGYGLYRKKRSWEFGGL